jgi:hypothetical protein
MAFETLDLGRIIATAEGIKGMKRQADTDKLRDAYMNTQMQGAQQSQQFAAQDQKAQMDERTARQHYLANQAIETSQDPKAAVMQFAPEIPQQYDQAHGPGSFQLLEPEEIKSLARFAKEKAAAAAGINTQPDPNVLAQQSFAREMDTTNFGQQKELAKIQHGYRVQEGRGDSPVNAQLVTRPVGNGMVQDFAWNPRTNQREPSGEPYKPVTPHTGNVTEGERKAAALGTRLESALQSLNGIEQKAPGASRPGIIERGLEGIGMETAANAVRSSDRQQADSAQLDALDAALTLATGAAYTRDQLQNLRKSYFPQIGDSDENVKAKQARFETIVKTARIASGRAEPSIDKAVGPAEQPVATATGPNGQKLYLRNGQWSPQ